MRIGRLALALAAPFLLASCFLSPGKFVSTLDIRKDRSFTFTYVGEIISADGKKALTNSQGVRDSLNFHYDLALKNTSLDNLGQYDCVLIVTDHSDYDFAAVVRESKLVIDSRNATKGLKSANVVHC